MSFVMHRPLLWSCLTEYFSWSFLGKVPRAPTASPRIGLDYLPARNVHASATSAAFKLESKSSPSSTATMSSGTSIGDEGKKEPARKLNGSQCLAYEITFPSTNKQLAVPTTKAPVVYMIGWAGCKMAHLSRYSPIFEDQGCITIRYIAPTKELVKCEYGTALEKQACSLLGLLKDLKLEEHPIFFHVFSNSGALVYSLMNRHFINDARILSKVRGVTFDSCPAKLTFREIMRSMVLLANGGLPSRYTMAVLWSLRLVFYSLIWPLGNQQPGSFVACLPTYNTLLSTSPMCPHLFLYSDKDQICPYPTIQDFIRKCRSRGMPVEEVFFKDSPHVRHFAVHRDEYVTSVVKFMQRCLQDTVQAP